MGGACRLAASSQFMRSALLFARLEAIEEELHALRKRCDAGSLSERDLACRVDRLLPHDRAYPMPFGGAATSGLPTADRDYSDHKDIIMWLEHWKRHAYITSSKEASLEYYVRFWPLGGAHARVGVSLLLDPSHP